MTDSLLMSTTDTSVSESLQNLVQMFFSILTDNVFNATVPLFPSCTIQETHTPFNGPLSRTIWVDRYQQKHSPNTRNTTYNTEC